MLSILGGAALAQETQVLAVADCRVATEYAPVERLLHIRVSGNPGDDCMVAPEEVAMALDKGLAGRDDLQSIFLGRFEDYPWFGERILKLAAQDDRPGGAWDGVAGKARGTNDNAYVADLIGSRRKVPFAATTDSTDILWPLREVLSRHGYVVTGASAEKVITQRIVSPVGGGEKRRLPTDALVHLRIQKAP